MGFIDRLDVNGIKIRGRAADKCRAVPFVCVPGGHTF